MPAYETNAVTLRLSGYRGTCKQPWQWLHRAVTLGGQFFCSGCGVYLSGTTALFYRPRVHTLSQNPLIFFFFLRSPDLRSMVRHRLVQWCQLLTTLSALLWHRSTITGCMSVCRSGSQHLQFCIVLLLWGTESKLRNFNDSWLQCNIGWNMERGRNTFSVCTAHSDSKEFQAGEPCVNINLPLFLEW